MADFTGTPILGWILSLHPFLAILLITFATTLFVTLVYKWTTDQKLMRELRDKTKKLQDDMKKHQTNPSKMLKVQKDLMDVNLKYMAQSLRPTIFTLIPLLILFAWLHSALAYDPISPLEPFTTTLVVEDGITGNVTLIAPEGINITSASTVALPGNQIEWKDEDGKTKKGNIARWTLIGNKPGEYLLEYRFMDKPYTKEVLITNKQAYYTPVKLFQSSVVREAHVSNRTLIVLDAGIKFTWFWMYIILSIVFSLAMRKVMNIY